MRARPFLVVLMLGMSPAAAMAEGPSQTPAASASSVDPAWYGWQAIIVDALSGGLLALSSQVPAQNGGVAVALVGVTDLVVTAPLIHAAHAQAGRAGISVAMRLGLTLLGGLFGVAAGGSMCQPPPPPASPGAFFLGGLDCLGAQIDGALVGAGVGMAIAVIVDDSALAWDRPLVFGRDARSQHSPRLQWMPTAGVAYDASKRQVSTFGIGATF